MKKLLLILFLLTVQIYSQNIKVKTYTPLDGLPDLFVEDITQDTTGRMWFASRKGISVYDATKWQLYNIQNGLPDAEYFKITVDEKGTLWGLPQYTSQNIVFFKNGTWNTIPSKNIANKNSFYNFEVIYEKNNPIIFVVIDYNLLYYYKMGEWNQLTRNNEEIITSIKRFGNELFFVQNGKLFKVNADLKIEDIKIKNLPNNIIKISSSENGNPDINGITLLGETWIGKITKNKFKRYSNINLYEQITLPSESGKYVYLLSPADGNIIIFGNAISIFTWNKLTDEIEVLGKRNGFSTEGATSIFVDREDNIWITTHKGVHKIKRTPFINYHIEDGLLENGVTAVSQLKNNKYLLGHNSGLTIFSDNFSKKIKFKVERNKASIYSRVLQIKKDLSNDIWLTANLYGLGKISNNNSVDWVLNKLDHVISSIHIDENKIWIGTESGIYLLKNNKLTSPEGFPEFLSYIRNIYRFNKKYLSIASTSGVFEIGKGHFKKFESREYPKALNAYCLFNYSDTILVGTIDGLFYIKNNELIKYNNNNLSIENSVYWITEDNNKNLWFGTDDGVIKWNGTKEKRFSVADGLAGFETNRGTGFIDDKGQLWIGTDKGLSCYHPEFDKNKEVKPKAEFLYLEDFSGNHYDLKNNIELNYNQNNFIINYRGISFIDENSISYKIKINNTSTDWEDEFTTSSASSRFTNLEPGDYVFSLTANNGKNTWSNKIFSASVTINSPYYYQAWFYAIIILGAGVVFFSVQNYYQQRKYSHKLENDVKERTKLLKKSEENIRNLTQELFKIQEMERQKISRDLHDNVAQDLLTLKINLSTLFDENKNISDDLNNNIRYQINILEKSIQSVRDLSYNLRPPELDQFGLIQSLQEFCKEFEEKRNINIDFISSGFDGTKFQQKAAINIYRLVQEALNNVSKHANATLVKIRIISSYPIIILRIEDNGIGFNVDEKLKFNIRKHMGLQSMKERTALLNGTFEIKPTQYKGTKIKIEIPFEGNII